MKRAFIFPGQGAQYPGMGRDFFENFTIARQTFEEANDTLGRDVTSIIFNGPEEVLTETHNSQVGIYVVSVAIMRVLQELNPDFVPAVTAGLSLGEYTALTAAGILSFANGLELVQLRGKLMSEACEQTEGAMAVVLGLSAEDVEAFVKEVNLPNDLFAANFNCPGQVVISGTVKGVEAGTKAAIDKGAKRVLPLSVHGAFHSGLMQPAEEAIKDTVNNIVLQSSSIPVVMNVTAKATTDLSEIRQNLIHQITRSVRWEQSIRTIETTGVDLFIEMGCGKTLAGFNKRIKPAAPTISVETLADLDTVKEQVG